MPVRWSAASSSSAASPRASAAWSRARRPRQEVAARGAALAQGQVHMLRGTSEPEKMLKNAKTEFQSEAEEIGTYTAIETLAKIVGDRDDRAAREGDPARGEAHGGVPREADPAADPGRREGGDPAARAQRRAAHARAPRSHERRRTHEQPQHRRPRSADATTSRRAERLYAQQGLAQHGVPQPLRRQRSQRPPQWLDRSGSSARSGATQAHDRPAHRLAAARAPSSTFALTGGAPAAPPARRGRLARAGALAQSHRPRKPACMKSFSPAAANTAVTVRPVRGWARRTPTRPSAVHAPTQRLHVTSSPRRAESARRAGACGPRGRRRTARAPKSRPSRAPRSSRSRTWLRSAAATRSHEALGVGVAAAGRDQQPREQSGVTALIAPYCAGPGSGSARRFSGAGSPGRATRDVGQRSARRSATSPATAARCAARRALRRPRFATRPFASSRAVLFAGARKPDLGVRRVEGALLVDGQPAGVLARGEADQLGAVGVRPAGPPGALRAGAGAADESRMPSGPASATSTGTTSG